MKRNRARYADLFLSILFPKRCLWCDQVIGFADGCACEEAFKKLVLPNTPLSLNQYEGCRGEVDQAWACYTYKNPVKQTFYRLKFEKEPELAVPLGQKMADKAMKCKLADQFDCVVPVPVSKETFRERGYNQSALLAQEVAREIHLPCTDNWLKKTKETEKQMELGREERLENVKGAYVVESHSELQGKRVLIIDDVLTTGSTVNECAKTLLSAGVKSCGAFTLMTVTHAEN